MIREANILPVFLIILSYTGLLIAAEKTTAEPASIPMVAVHALESRGIDKDEAATLTDVLRSKLMNTQKFQVMERGQMEAILQEQAFQQSGACTDQECIVEMGQILGIEQVIAGSIGQVGKAYSINIRVIAVATGKILNSVSHSYTGPIESLLTKEMAVVANKLSGIQTVYEPRAPKKRKPNKKKRRRNVIITGVAVAAVGGGVAAIVLLRGGDDEEVPTTLGVTWIQQ